MSATIHKLQDGRYLAAKAIEIASFPSLTYFGATSGERGERLNQIFRQLVTELHRLCDQSVCIELLWITEKADSQAFRSSVRLFAIIRKIGTDFNHTIASVDLACGSMTTVFSAQQFQTTDMDLEKSRLSELVASVDHSCVLGIAKQENYSVTSNSAMPYYTSEILPHKNYANFNGMITAMSQMENCCVSFQLFPTSFEAAEKLMIQELTSGLTQISSGVMTGSQMYRDPAASAPLKYYSYYNEHLNAPMFMCNALVFGGKGNCESLAATVISQMQSGTEQIGACNLDVLDLSTEEIRLSSQFLTYVWNIRNRIQESKALRKPGLSNTALSALSRLSMLVTADETVAFFRLPVHEPSMPALQSNQHVSVIEQFDKGVVDPKNIQFGSLMQSDAGQIMIGSDPVGFAKHALIVGMPGSGKTTFSVHLLLQFAKKHIPFLVIEPTKTEYRGMIDAIDNLKVFTPGKNDVSPFVINPFVPPRGIRLEQYIYGLSSAFQAAFSMPPPLDILFPKAIQECYSRYGWKDYSTIDDPDVKLFGMHEFIIVFKSIMKNLHYSKEIMGNIESAGVLRLTSLIEQNSNIYDTVHSVPIEDLLGGRTVLELNAIYGREQKALVIALLLMQIGLYTKNNHKGDGNLKQILMIDEAHVLLGGQSASIDGHPDAHAASVQAVQDLIVEIRSYGTGIIIADQAPSQVSRPVVANTDIKIAFRLVESLEKQMIGDTTNMTEDEMNRLSRLKPGEAYVYYQKLERPQLIKTPEIRSDVGIRLSVPDEEIARRDEYWGTHKMLLKPFPECEYCANCKETCDFKARSIAEQIARSLYWNYVGKVKDELSLRGYLYNLPELEKDLFRAVTDVDMIKLQICTRIRLYRKLSREKSFQVREEALKLAITQFPKQSAYAEN